MLYALSNLFIQSMAPVPNGSNSCAKLSVCVMGAGAAGLCALRHFAARLDHFGPLVCFEQTEKVGGTWNYTEQTGIDHTNGLPVNTSMYRDLRTNAPIQIMQFPDYQLHWSKSFVHHSKYLHYLQSYSDHFDLSPFIHFKHHIQQVTRDQSNSRWSVTLLDIEQERTFTAHFDIVILCPGRWSVPLWPKIASISTFAGSIVHTHDYRCREPYSDKVVGIIGGGRSGIDICVEVSAVARKVILINRANVQYSNLPSNVHQIKGNVQQFRSNSMIIKDQNNNVQKLIMDCAILATGYRMNLNCLDQSSSGLRVNADDTIDGLYRHLINIQQPTMALVGITNPAVSFVLFHQQILYYIKVLLGEIALPTKTEMQSEVLPDLEERKSLGYRDRDRHQLKIDLMQKYCAKLETDAKLKPLSPVIWAILQDIVQARNSDPVRYKDNVYRLVDEQTFEKL